MLIYTVQKSSKTYKKQTSKVRTGKKIKKKKIHFGQLGRSFLKGMKYATGITLVVGTVGVAASGTYKYYKTNEFLVLKDVVCEGNRHLSRSDILDLLQIEFGEKLLEIHPRKMADELCRHPWINGADVSRRLPSSIVVELEEKKPVAICRISPAGKGNRSGAGSSGLLPGWYGVSASGEFLPEISLNQFDLPVVSGEGPADSARQTELMAFLEHARENFPGIYHTVSQIRHEGSRNYSICLRDSRLRYLVSMDTAPRETLNMWDLLVAQKGEQLKPGQTVDLRVPGFAYIR